MTFPEITTERLRLTAIADEDAKSVFALFSDDAVTRYYDLASFTDMAQALELIKLFQSRFATNMGIRWAIRLADTLQLIGTCGFNSWNPSMKNAVLGYDLRSDYWHCGYAQEAVRAIIAAAFSGGLPCGALHRIQADTLLGNSASENLLLRLGFQEEGLRRDSGYWKGSYHSLKCFGLLQHEYSNP